MICLNEPASEEDDGGARGRHRRQRASTFRVAVQLGDDARANVHRFVERRGLVVNRLPLGGVQDEHDVVRLHRRANVLRQIYIQG